MSRPRLLFRSPLSLADAPQAGEVLVRVAPQAPARSSLAVLALQSGPAAFAGGSSDSIHTIAVSADPSFDDMLAAFFLQEKLGGGELPTDSPFAHHAASMAAGLHPSDSLPPEDTLEGIYAYIRHTAGEPLTDPEKAARFLAGWAKLASAIRSVLHDPAFDPTRQSLIANRPEFQAERLHVRSDRKVYERDLSRGERFLIRIPEQSGDVGGLRVAKPESVLFKYWARTDPHAPGGDGYHFLAVTWGPGDWFFSTDPLRRYRIGSLAEPLQAAEGTGTEDTWYDGRRHEFSIVRTPRCGSKLSDAAVWSIVRRWGHVRPVSGNRKFAFAGAAVAALVAIALLIIPGSKKDPEPQVQPIANLPTPPAHVSMGDPVSAFVKPGAAIKWDYWNAKFDANQATASKTLSLGPATVDTGLRLFVRSSNEQKPPLKFRLKLPGGSPIEFSSWEGTAGEWRTKPSRLTLRGGTAPDATLEAINLQADELGDYDLFFGSCPDEYELHLHATAIGVSDYGASAKLEALPFARNDAVDMVKAFEDLRQKKEGSLFTDIRTLPPLVEPDANGAGGKAVTRKAILEHLEEFKRRVTGDPARKFAIISISGHGKVYREREYLLLPHDFDSTDDTTGFSWSWLQIHLREFNCPVLLILDTCHSGQVVRQAGQVSMSAGEDLDRVVEDFSKVRSGLYILAGAEAEGKAWGPAKGAGKYSYLTEAVLDVLAQGRTPVGHRGGVVSVQDLYQYVRGRVPERAVDKDGKPLQKIVPYLPGQADVIPLLYRFPEK